MEGRRAFRQRQPRIQRSDLRPRRIGLLLPRMHAPTALESCGRCGQRTALAAEADAGPTVKASKGKDPTGVEPATGRLKVDCSTQLSYGQAGERGTRTHTSGLRPALYLRA